MLHGEVELLALGGTHAGEGGAAAVEGFRVHALEAAEFVERADLGLGREGAEAGIALEGALLIGGREVAVLLHPHLQAGAVLGGAAGVVLGEEHEAAAGDGGGQKPGARTRELSRWGGRHVALRLRVGGCEGGSQQQDRAKTEPGWRERSHTACVATEMTEGSANRGHMFRTRGGG